MKMMSMLFACGLAVLGCKKKSEDAAPAGDRCTTAIHASVDKMLARSKEGGAPPQMLEIANKLRTIMTERCKADGWPDAVIACFANATDQPSIKACRTQLPQEQAQRLQTEIIKVMSGAARPGGMRGGMGGSATSDEHDLKGGPSGSAASNPPAGEAMGGAGAGSAAPSGSAATAGSAN
jgi:hypothetical protein